MGRLFASAAASPHGTIRLLITLNGSSESPGAPVVTEVGSLAPLTTAPVRPWVPLRGTTGSSAVVEPGWSTLVELAAQGRARLPLRISVAGDNAAAVELVAKPLPAEIPSVEAGSFNVLLVSCYCRDEDNHLLVGEEASRIARKFGIDLTLLMGDQVYLDIPTLDNLPSNDVLLADALERKYRNNFVPDGNNFSRVLEFAPNLAVPDDHEYWNNAPHASPFIENAWTQSGRNTWHGVADSLFTGYQGFSPSPGDGAGPFKHTTLDVGRLSFFVANTRSFRTEDRARCMDPATAAALVAWESGLQSSGRFGVLVTGQSLLDPEADAFEGKVADYALSNYGDFPLIAGVVDRLSKRSDVLLLTGDVHWGRVARLSPTSDISSEASIYEVISSPSALVTTVGGDSLKTFFSWLSGSKDKWPRHADAPVVPRMLRLKGAATPFWAETLHRQKGNMLCLLSFSMLGNSVQVTPRYFPVGQNRIDEVKPFTLRRR